MTEVRFKTRFMDWQKDEKAKLPEKFVDRYLAMGVCNKVKAPAKRKNTRPPSNKRAAASNIK